MMMMMMTEVSDQKRRSHDSFLLNNIAGAGGGHSHNSSITTTAAAAACSGLTAKRLKTGSGGGGGGTITTKEKKDKIGARVAKLQQLVSPFGKSDTASVLQETTGYIKFLHDQLQVLSAPYLRMKTLKTEEAESCSLRSRGLCLVPISSTLKIAQSNGADLWAPVGSNTQP